MTHKNYVSPADCELCAPTITTSPTTGITISAHEPECLNHPFNEEGLDCE